MFRGCLAYGQHLLIHELDMIIAANQGRQLRPTFEGPTWGSGCMPGPCEKGASQELIETVNVFARDNLDPVLSLHHQLMLVRSLTFQANDVLPEHRPFGFSAMSLFI
mmetsp:Transcript_61363/g.190190  ORF Transcript_61363/g.190190 Transcript_61363/m.190190 type:complete len:107 (-) Transcript_61363:759-1079(-)